MRMRCLWVLVTLVAMAGVADAKSVGHTYGAFGEGQIYVEQGDQLMAPAFENLVYWVNQGIEAAIGETGVLQTAAAQSWLQELGGIPCYDGDLRFAVALTPQLVATTAGWAAAWDPATWARIQNGEQQTVAQTIAQNVAREVWARDVRVMLGVSRDDTAAPIRSWGVMYAYGDWRDVEVRFTVPNAVTWADDISGPPWNREWAGRYLTAWMMYDSALSDPGYITVATASLLQRQRQAPRAELVEAVGYAGDGSMRLVVGRPEEFALIDW